ncbi:MULTISPECIES: YgzB family protein [Paenibacillus]|uniref:YgzB family protein n=1 Tax=Paenibacillus TaxID=44249 RepID=UPI002FE37026
MFFKSSKINEFRLWGLLLTMSGMGLMVLGTAGIVFWGQSGKVIAGIGLVIGLIAMMASLAIYFWAGMLSTSAVQLECPECHKLTKMLGKTDRCMFCKTILTLDPHHATITAEEIESRQTLGQTPETNADTKKG